MHLRSALGDTVVRESPPGSNRGARIDRWLAFTGLAPGYAYCAAWLSYRLHGPPEELGWPPDAGRVVSPAVISARARDFLTTEAIPARKVLAGTVRPRPGWIIVWRKGSTPLGHVGLVLAVCGDNDFLTLEANTGPGAHGSQRDGDGVYVRRRRIEPFAHFRIVAFVPVVVRTSGCTQEADMLGSLLGSVLSAGGGGLIDSLGGMLGTSLFGTGGSSQSAADQAMADLQARAPGLTKAAMYNAAGQTGQDVEDSFRRRLAGLQHSADASRRASMLDGLASGTLAAGGEQFGAMMQQQAQQQGALRGQATQSLLASGASPAAISAAMRGMAGAQARSGAGLIAQAAEQNRQNMQAAGGLTSQAQGLLAQDLAQRNAIYVDPFRAQLNGGIAPLAGQMAALGSSNQQDLMVNNPLAGFGTALGGLGGGLMSSFFNQQQPTLEQV